MRYPTLLLGLALLFSACQPSQPSAPEKDYTKDIERIESGLLPSLIIEGAEPTPQTIQERMAHYQVPGVSIAFFENGAIQWTRTYGYLSRDSLQAVDEATRFQAASISKPVAATGLLTLVEAGVLDLDADVNTYLQAWRVPENRFTEQEKVTLRRLVSHNAGLTVHGFRGYAADEAVPTTVQVLDGAEPANSDPIVADTLPGAIWRYSGGGYTVMQRVVEESTGQSFPAFLQNAVLTPLDMARSTYEQPLPEGKRDNIAIGHRGDGSKVAGDWHTYPEIAAAGLWTTPSDLARWALAVQAAYNGGEDQLLSPEMARAMLSRQAEDWGLGPALDGEADSLVFSHGGANEGYRCYLLAFARAGGPGAVVMTNNDTGGALFTEIMRSISDVYGWNKFRSTVKKVIDLPAEAKAAFTGAYAANDQLRIRFELEGDTLRGYPVWDMAPFAILPEGDDTFFDPQDGTTLAFFRNDEGAVAGFEAQGFRFEREGE